MWSVLKDKGIPPPCRLLQPHGVVVAVCPLLLLRLGILGVAQGLHLGQLRIRQDVWGWTFVSLDKQEISSNISCNYFRNALVLRRAGALQIPVRLPDRLVVRAPLSWPIPCPVLPDKPDLGATRRCYNLGVY